MAHSLFLGVEVLKTFPIIAKSLRSSEFDAVRRIFVLEKTVAYIVNFTFHAIMADLWAD